MNITDRVMIQIVGSIGVHQAEVVRLRPDGEPYLSVLDEEGWPILKPGDYVLWQGLQSTEMTIEWDEL